MIGVNLSGAEFGSGSRYGYDYIYPSENELDFYKSKGVELIRLPFKWERMQSHLGDDLNQAELARMKNFLGEAEERGMKVVIDLHNYGRYMNQALGTDNVPVSSFADFWQKLATELKGNAAIAGYDLMNEPHDLGGSFIWPTAAQAAVNAIRSVDMSTAIYVEGDGWSGAQSWLAGADRVEGSYGTDTMTYVLSTKGVTVDLSIAVQSGSGDAAGDSLVSIERINGSRFDDKLSGDSGANVLNGEAGNDILQGKNGNDLLFGGAGTDTARFTGKSADYVVSRGTDADGAWTQLVDRTTGRDASKPAA